MKSLPIASLLTTILLTSFTTQVSAAAFELSPNIATLDIPLSLSASGYVNNQTITATGNIPGSFSLIPHREQPFSATPLQAYLFAYALDDKPDGSRCFLVNSDYQYSCLDGAAPKGSEEAAMSNFGDAELEYLQLGSNAKIQIDQPVFVHGGNPQGSNNEIFGTILGEVPLSLLASSTYSASINLTGDLYLNRAVLVIDYQLNDTTNPVPLPGALWLFGAALIGLTGMQRKSLLGLPRA